MFSSLCTMKWEVKGNTPQKFSEQTAFSFTILQHNEVFSFPFFKILFIHKRYTHTHTEAETQAEGEAVSMQGVLSGTPSWNSRITPCAEGGAKLLSHPGCPDLTFLTSSMTQLLRMAVLGNYFPPRNILESLGSISQCQPYLRIIWGGIFFKICLFIYD